MSEHGGQLPNTMGKCGHFSEDFWAESRKRSILASTTTRPLRRWRADSTRCATTCARARGGRPSASSRPRCGDSPRQRGSIRLEYDHRARYGRRKLLDSPQYRRQSITICAFRTTNELKRYRIGSHRPRDSPQRLAGAAADRTEEAHGRQPRPLAFPPPPPDISR